jgi:hypothetical protein
LLGTLRIHGFTSGERMRKQRGGSMRDLYRREWGYDNQPANATGDGPTGDSRPVTAQLTGSAEVKGDATLTVKIEAPELIRAYHQAQSAIQLAG